MRGIRIHDSRGKSRNRLPLLFVSLVELDRALLESALLRTERFWSQRFWGLSAFCALCFALLRAGEEER